MDVHAGLGRGGVWGAVEERTKTHWMQKFPSPAQPVNWWSAQHLVSPGCGPGHAERSASSGDSAHPPWRSKFTLRTCAVRRNEQGALEPRRAQLGAWAVVLILTGRWQCWARKQSCPARGLPPVPGAGQPPPGIQDGSGRAGHTSHKGLAMPAGATQHPMALPSAVVRPE